ncbi:hypothetical protein [Nocardia jiangsuensis]|uniref:Uncharacterized protein n=1 Tax=Nocardia jiangsuensis TaxID=1691563 RepID=A0ABV8DU77_9NOCA
MPTSEEAIGNTGLAEQIAGETKAIVTRLALVKADLDALSTLAHGVAMAVDALLPQPTPTGGSLEAVVSLGQSPEAAE